MWQHPIYHFRVEVPNIEASNFPVCCVGMHCFKLCDGMLCGALFFVFIHL